MKLERISKEVWNRYDQHNDPELYAEIKDIMAARTKAFGNCGGNWVCDKCGNDMHSFLRNFDIHIPEVCPKCNEGKMIEDEKRRSFPPVSYIIDKSREKNWEHGLSPAQQASVLLGESDPY